MRSFLASLALVLMCTAQVTAQGVPIGWQTDPTLGGDKAKFFNLLKANNIDSDRQGVEKFFDNYYFARWTLPASTGLVRGYSQELLTQDFKDLTGPARDYLLNKTFDTLRKMAADQTVTPTARFNAIYTIGQLNQRDAPNTNSPSVPYAPVLPYLVREYEREDANPDYLRLGALLGIRRHAILGITDAEMKDATVPNLLVKIVQDGKPNQTRAAEEQEILDRFRLRALEALGALKSTGPRGEIVDLFVSVIENSQENIDMRCDAATTLADLSFQAADTAGIKINHQRVGTVLISLAKATCDIELRRVEAARNKEKAQAGRVTPFGAQEDIDPDFAVLPPDAQQEVTNSVQRLKTHFTQIVRGIRGERLTGATTVGIRPMLPAEDPIAIKLESTVRLIGQLLKFLDEGPTERPAPPVNVLAEDGGGERRAAPRPAANMLKVNLGLIRDKLQEFSTALDGIIAG